jgi:UDP-3-O-[3-hydroxymyristoyl] glucosamine N-acyltransferase
MLEHADSSCVTYYSGSEFSKVAHLQQCILICTHMLEDRFSAVSAVVLVRTDNPQLTFYELSSYYEQNFLDFSKMDQCEGAWIHRDARIANSANIGPGCVIGACAISEESTVSANCTIYSGTMINSEVIIEPNTVIGATGVMWAWRGNERVSLAQLGNVIIESGCFIGSNVTIVRGRPNETTTIGKYTLMSHGTKIGHGCYIGEYNHFGNNVSLGGGVTTTNGCFMGSGCTIAPGVSIDEECIIGAGATLVKNVSIGGIYSGVPAKRQGEMREDMRGVPSWKHRLKGG